MIEFSISELYNCLNGIIINKSDVEQSDFFSANQNTAIPHIYLDSRKIKSGDIFVAIIGSNTNSHSYLPQAQENGAVLAIVSELNPNITLPQLVVINTIEALGLITQYLNSKWQKPAVTITGSSGKTTTKFILNAILNTNGQVLCSESSFNNNIGVPLTMFNADEKQWAGIFEMGTNHQGEIPYLAKLVDSKVAMLLNVSAGHIGNYNNVEEILHEKANIFNGLVKDGTAIISKDLFNKEYVVQHVESINKTENKNIKLLTFGLDSSADCYADKITIMPTHSEFSLNYQNKSIIVKLGLLGQHQVLNAVAASLAALVLGLSLEQVKHGLEAVQPVTKRMQPIKLTDNLFVIDDSYNANPASVAEAIKFLASLSGKKIFVLGNLGELGEHSTTSHKDIGDLAKKYHVDKLLALGEDTKYTLQAFYSDIPSAHMPFESKQDLLTNLLNYLSDTSNYDEQCTILIKGSNYMRMWEITDSLKENIKEKI